MDHTDWDRVLRTALEEAALSRDSQVVLGAIFSTYVRQVVKRERPDVQYPPDSDRSFKDFLLSHPETVWVIARKNQDLLVAHPQASGEVARKVAPARLREDLYSAFTDLDSSRAYLYDAKEDVAQPMPDPESLLRSLSRFYPIPLNTIGGEVKIRQAFLESETLDEGVASALRDALGGDKPLAAFSAVLRENQISKLWHDFKFARLLQRVRDWSAGERLPWGSSWIESAVLSTNETSASPTGLVRAGIGQMLGALDEADLARIMVPLDLVAKLLAGQGRAH